VPILIEERFSNRRREPTGDTQDGAHLNRRTHVFEQQKAEAGPIGWARSFSRSQIETQPNTVADAGSIGNATSWPLPRVPAHTGKQQPRDLSKNWPVLPRDGTPVAHRLGDHPSARFGYARTATLAHSTRCS